MITPNKFSPSPMEQELIQRMAGLGHSGLKAFLEEIIPGSEQTIKEEEI